MCLCSEFIRLLKWLRYLVYQWKNFLETWSWIFYWTKWTIKLILFKKMNSYCLSLKFIYKIYIPTALLVLLKISSFISVVCADKAATVSFTQRHLFPNIRFIVIPSWLQNLPMWRTKSLSFVFKWHTARYILWTYIILYFSPCPTSIQFRFIRRKRKNHKSIGC